MSRNYPTRRVNLDLGVTVIALLERLRSTGLYGGSIGDVVERIVCRELSRLQNSGELLGRKRRATPPTEDQPR